MSADDFFSRWSRRKSETPAAPETSAVPAAEPVSELPPPTLEDVAALGHDADFSRFVKPGVDETVRRSAMKKLFTDPHFNVMDGLDIYIGDYNTFEPLPPAMLAMLLHARPLLDPLGHLQQPAMKMLDRLEQLAGESAATGESTLPADDVQTATAQVTMAPDPDEPATNSGQAIENAVVNGSAADTPAAETPRNPASPEDDHTIQSL